MGARDEFVVRRSRAKFGVLVAGTGVFALLGVLGAAAGGGLGLVFCALFFGPLCIFAITQLFNRRPALVIDHDGIVDHRSGLRVTWDEVEAVRLRTFRVRLFLRHYWLLLRVEDIDRLVERLPKRFGRAVGRLDAKLGTKEALVVLNLLERSPREILAAVRRYYDGAVEDAS